MAALRKICLGLALLLMLPISAGDATAQTATVRGTVRDSLTRRPLQSASVVLMRDGAALYGTATDGDGFFVLPRVAFGDYELHVTFVGYEAHQRMLAVSDVAPTFVRVALEASEGMMDEVVVEGEAETGVAVVRAGLHVVRPKDIQRVPILGASGDLAALLQTMPGFAAQGDRGGQVFIRGGSTDQNLALLDGMPIYQPFHVVSFFSVFPEEIVDHANVYTGSFGAAYSTRLSSVLDVEMRNGNKERLAGSASIAPFLSGLRLEGPLVKDRVSFVGSARRSLVEELTPNLYGQRLPYRFSDQFAKLHALIGTSHGFSATVLRTSDRGDIAGSLTDFEGDFVPESPEASEDRETSWSNSVVGGRYTFRPHDLPLLLELRASKSQAENGIGPSADSDRTATIESRDIGIEATISSSFGEVKTGALWRESEMEFRLGGQFQDLSEGRLSTTEVSAFAESVLNRTDEGLDINPGVSVYVLPDRNEFRLEPRLRLAWRIRAVRGQHSLHVGAGRYHQLVTGLSDERDVGNVFTVWVPTADSLALPEAWHLMVGWNARLSVGVALSLEGYHKSFSNLSVPVFTPFPSFTTSLQSADGTARGVEMRLEADPRPFIGGSTFSGYLGYSISNVEYRTQQFSYHPAHHRRHQATAVVRVERSGVGVSVQWQFGSGFPFTRSAGFDVWQHLTPNSDVAQDPGTARVLYLDPFGGRQPNYERIDIWLDKTVDLQRVRATVRAGVLNVLNRDNLFYFDLFTLRRVDQMPIVPSVAFRIDLL